MTERRPVVFDRGSAPPDAWESFLAEHPVSCTHDRLDEQLEALARVRAPGADDAALRAGVAELLAGGAPEGFGRWVHFPWSGELVHVLPPDAFVELRGAKEAAFPWKRVAIVGLPLGLVAAVPLAHHVERLVLVGSGPVAEQALRRIWVANPYVEVQVHDEADVDGLFAEGDVELIVQAGPMAEGVRERAHAAGLPVVCLRSEPQGLVLERAVDPCGAQLSSVLSALGADALPAEDAARLLDEGLPPRPAPHRQAVVHALSEVLASDRAGRVMLDRDPLLEHPGLASVDATPSPTRLPEPGWTKGDVVHQGMPHLVRSIVQAATLAPSAGNRQPWAFRYDGESLWVLRDPERSRGLFDLRQHDSLLAIGAALENLRIATEEQGYSALINAFPLDGRPDVVARVFVRPGIPAGPAVRRLAEVLRVRSTQRAHGGPRPLAGRELMALIEASRSRGANLEVCVNEGARQELGRLLGAAERLRMLCEPLQRERVGELRFDRSAADGIALDQLVASDDQRTLLRLASRPDVVRVARAPGRGRALEGWTRQSVEASSAVALLSIDRTEPLDWLRAGTAVQRTWLAATSVGLAVHPLNTAVSLLELAQVAPDTFLDWEHAELVQLRSEFQGLFNGCRERTPVFLFRLTHHDATGQASPRRAGRLPLERVLGWGSPDDL